MDTILYSATTNAFYDTKHKYTPSIPADAIDIGHAAHKALLAAKKPADQWVAGADGKPMLRARERPALSQLKLAAGARLKVSAKQALVDALLSDESAAPVKARFQTLKAKIIAATDEATLDAIVW